MNGLVLGSSSGLGKFCAEQFSRRGDNVVGLARSTSNSDLFREASVDLTDYSTAEKVIKSIFSEHSFNYLLFTCGGVVRDSVYDIDLMAFESLYAKNVASLIIPLQAFITQAVEPTPKSIVLISSVHARGEPERISYAVTKAALEAIMTSSYQTLAKKGISINCIRPGPIESVMLQQSFPKGSPERQEYLSEIPTGRFAAFDDIWHHVDLLTSPKGVYTTGQCIEVSGGY